MCAFAHLSNLTQVLVFVNCGSYKIALAQFAINLWALRLQVMFMSSGAQLRKLVNMSVATGFVEPSLTHFISISKGTQAAFGIHVAMCGVLLQANALDFKGNAITCANFALAAYSLATEITSNHLGDEMRQWGKAVVVRQHGKCVINMLLLWDVALVSSEVWMASMVACVHPWCLLLFFMPALCVQVKANWNKDESVIHQVMVWFGEPLSLMCFVDCSVFNFKLRSLNSSFVRGPKPALPMLVAFVARICIFAIVMAWQWHMLNINGDVFAAILLMQAFSQQQFARAGISFFCAGSLFCHISTLACLTCYHPNWVKGTLDEERHAQVAVFFREWKRRRQELLSNCHNFDEENGSL